MDFPLFVYSMYYLYCTIESCFFVYKKKCLYSLLRVIHEIKFLERQVLMSQLQFSSVAQSCPTLCELMDCSTPCLPVHHQLPEFTQTHVHRVGDAIQPSHVLSSPSPPAFNLSQHQGLFQCIRWPKYWSFSFSISPSNEHSGLISCRMDWTPRMESKGLSRVFSNTTVKHNVPA